MWVVLADGSEVEMRDDLTDGAPFLLQDPCRNGEFDRNRGRVWHSTDGSAISYLADVNNGLSPLVNNFSGSVFLPDGTRLVIGTGGRCSKMIDRNGNVLDFAYDDTGFGAVTYADQLGRQVICSATAGGATVSILGYNWVSSRTVFIDASTIGANPRADYSSLQQPIYNSDADLNGVHSDGNPHTDVFPGSDVFAGITMISEEPAISQVRLLDGRRFQFRYNKFGELAEIIYPGGGVSRIDYQPFGTTIPEGAGVLSGQLNRRVTERRVIERRVYGGGGVELYPRLLRR